MAALKRSYVCNNCGAVYAKWQGQCEECNEWDTITEDESSVHKFSASNDKNKSGKKASASEVTLSNLSDNIAEMNRTDSGIDELNRVLGGGIVKGSAVLIGGEPGIGKSTLLLQVATSVSGNSQKALYITGEESSSQVSMRAKRLGIENAPVELASATNVSSIIATIKKQQPDIVIIDSIQTMFLPNIDSAPGTVSQVRLCSHELITLAKNMGFCLVLVGHVTKDGQIAGPRVLEHMVDTVLYFEGEKGYNFRILRAVKNRFGPANEIGVFEMVEKGLKEVPNPSSIFISENRKGVSGSVIFAGVEGTRPVLVEVQALVAPSYMANPRRAVVGWDSNRLAMIIAILQTRLGVQLYDKEIYLNIAGGIKINEPACDLAVAIAILSALNDKPVDHQTIVFGELGLSGEIRGVSRSAERLKEASKLGFKKAYMPDSTGSGDLEVKKLSHIVDLIAMFKSQ